MNTNSTEIYAKLSAKYLDVERQITGSKDRGWILEGGGGIYS